MEQTNNPLFDLGISGNNITPLPRHTSAVVNVDADWYVIPTMFGGQHYTVNDAFSLAKKIGFRDPDTRLPLRVYPDEATAKAAQSHMQDGRVLGYYGDLKHG